MLFILSFIKSKSCPKRNQICHPKPAEGDSFDIDKSDIKFLPHFDKLNVTRI